LRARLVQILNKKKSDLPGGKRVAHWKTETEGWNAGGGKREERTPVLLPTPWKKEEKGRQSRGKGREKGRSSFVNARGKGTPYSHHLISKEKKKKEERKLEESRGNGTPLVIRARCERRVFDPLFPRKKKKGEIRKNDRKGKGKEEKPLVRRPKGREKGGRSSPSLRKRGK